MKDVIMETVQLNKAFSLGETIYAVNNVNIKIERGSMNVIIGPSGSGKSTLLSLLGGLDRPMSGDVLLEGQSYRALSEDQLALLRRRKLGFVFQFFNLIPHLTALENVMLPLQFINTPHKAAKRRGLELLERVGLAKRSRHLPLQLSGGEQQRVAIARALANRPAVILADEPTGNLDTKTRDEIVALFQELNQQEKQTFVMVTHDPSLSKFADQLIVMQDGCVVSP
ncbi:MAG: ABC transporter ATP-binding protein [Firmicutes bacterium]|jgi:putative ABC transport system ATP-binding protein|nr:ABC transporter ATP-binding protein [Bacillota bacterium]